MKMLALVHCRGLIYQALPPDNSPVGFDESNPYFASRPFAFLAAIFIAVEKKMTLSRDENLFCIDIIGVFLYNINSIMPLNVYPEAEG